MSKKTKEKIDSKKLIEVDGFRGYLWEMTDAAVDDSCRANSLDTMDLCVLCGRVTDSTQRILLFENWQTVPVDTRKVGNPCWMAVVNGSELTDDQRGLTQGEWPIGPTCAKTFPKDAIISGSTDESGDPYDGYRENSYGEPDHD